MNLEEMTNGEVLWQAAFWTSYLITTGAVFKMVYDNTVDYIRKKEWRD